MSNAIRQDGRRRLQRDTLVSALLCAGALLLRCYRIDANPLWLDEIYGYQLGQLGLRAIFINSTYDPHPPLYYLIQWASSGFGVVHTEWAWRWFPALSGALAVPLVYRFARSQHVHWVAALLSCVLLALNPLHLYFSQEARSPAFVMLLAALSMHALWRIQRHPEQRRGWLQFALLAIVGLYTSFSFAVVVGCQLAYTGVVLRAWRKTILCGGLIAAAFAPMIFVALEIVTKTSQKLASGPSITFTQLADSLLGGDIVRYGQHWSHTCIVGALGMLAALGVWRGWRSDDRRMTTYLVLQVVLPLVGFFVAVAVLGVSLPVSEAKQFIGLLPAFFVLVAYGLQALLGFSPDTTRQNVQRSRSLHHSLGLLGCAVLVGATTCASVINLHQYWTTSRSPEGAAVLSIRAQMAPGDAIVSQHYSADAALSFYLPDVPHFTKPQRVAKRYLFGQSLQVLPFPVIPKAQIATKQIVNQYSHVWLLSLATQDAELVRDFAHYCARNTQEMFGPFRVTRFQQCRLRT